MNEITRKAANALVAAVDFFQGALAAEAQAGDAKQVQLDALAAHLKAAKDDREVLDLRQKNYDLECQIARLKAERRLTAQEAKVLLSFIDAARTMSNTIILRSRALRQDKDHKHFLAKLNEVEGIELVP